MGWKLPLDAAQWLHDQRITTMLPEQEGAYLRLLLVLWCDEHCSLPHDDASLAALSRLGERWATLGQAIRACFVDHPEHTQRLTHPGLFAEWQARKRLSEMRSNVGARGAARRWQKPNRGVAAQGDPMHGITFPTGWDTPEVREALQRWLAYKRSRKEKYKAFGQYIGTQFKRFPTPTAFVAAVEFSMAQGYAGIYPERSSARTTTIGTRKRTSVQDGDL